MNTKIKFDDLLNSVVGTDNQLSKNFARNFIKEMAAIIEEGLIRDGVVHVSDLGIFKLNDMPSRSIRNIQTGEMMEVPPKKRVMFKPEKTLRELINKQFEQLQPQIIEDAKSKKDDEVSGDFFSPVFEGAAEEKAEPKFNEKVALKEDKSIPENSVEKRETPAQEKIKEDEPGIIEAEKPSAVEEEKKNRFQIYAGIIAVLIIIFLLIKYTSDEEEPEVVDELQPPAPADSIPSIQQQEPIAEKDPAPPPKEISHSTKSGDNLWKLAKNYYKDAYLWPLIYEHNHNKVSNPDFIQPGTQLEVPNIINPKNLTPSEEKTLAEGHLLAYRAYKNKNHQASLNHLFVANELKPDLVAKKLTESDRDDFNKVITMNR